LSVGVASCVGMQLNKITDWLHSFGWQCDQVDTNTLRIRRSVADPIAFFVRSTTDWLLLKVIHVLPTNGSRPGDLSRRLLAVNRDIRLAKFVYEEDGDVALSAELPTESLQRSELRDAVDRMSRYVEHYRAYLSSSG